MEGGNEVKQLKKYLLLTLFLFLCSSTTAFGTTVDQADTEVGIGFTASPTMGKDPAKPMNVLPSTSTQSRDYSASAKRFPNTGEKRQTRFYQVIGLLCLMGCFWLFLGKQLKEEDAHE